VHAGKVVERVAKAGDVDKEEGEDRDESEKEKERTSFLKKRGKKLLRGCRGFRRHAVRLVGLTCFSAMH
jgi:hypothetical protein